MSRLQTLLGGRHVSSSHSRPSPGPSVQAASAMCCSYPWFFQQNMLETTNHTVITQNQVHPPVQPAFPVCMLRSQ